MFVCVKKSRILFGGTLKVVFENRCLVAQSHVVSFVCIFHIAADSMCKSQHYAAPTALPFLESE